MRYTGFVISVKDINASKKFYEELFDLEVYQERRLLKKQMIMKFVLKKKILMHF